MIGLYAIAADVPRGLEGARGEPLRAVRCGALVAVVGSAPPPLAADTLRAHEAAVRQISESVDACLPARFGACAADEAALRRDLAGREEELLEALALVRGREQMTVRVHGATGPAFPPREGGAGTRYLEERRRARRLPELDPLRAALGSLVKAEKIERHGEPGLLASVYHLVERGTAREYTERVVRVAMEGLRFQVSGPWPAWSFAPEVAPA